MSANPFPRSVRIVFPVVAVSLLSGCAVVTTGGAGASPARDRWAAAAVPVRDIDLRVTERAVVPTAGGDNLLRVRFSFVSYSAYPGAGDSLRSTGTVFFPVDGEGLADPSNYRQVVITEFPPGASASGLAILPEYGERPAVELGVAAAVVDLRGPVVRSLRDYANPADADGEAFHGEEQFGYAMLHAYQQTGDPELLYEHQVARAWLRAMAALDEVMRQEAGVTRPSYFLAGEGYGSVGAARAATYSDRVNGVVVCGWPLDWADYHFTRWRRWERRARYYPLESLAPIAYDDSRDLLSFLFSSYVRPDPGCPSCEGSGGSWREEFDVLDLWRDGRLRGAPLFVLTGDSDARFPIDLEARASVRSEDLQAFLPRIGPGDDISWRGEGSFGPFSARRMHFPFAGLRVLRDSPSTLASAGAVESVLAWVQHLSGYRDLPVIRTLEAVQGGDIRIEVAVEERNTAVTDVQIWLTEITDRRDSDFKWARHLDEPEAVRWRRIDAIYAGHDRNGIGRWKGFFPVDVTRNRAYYVLVRDRVGNLETAHSLPIRPLWNLGDPAVGPVRF